MRDEALGDLLRFNFGSRETKGDLREIGAFRCDFTAGEHRSRRIVGSVVFVRNKGDRELYLLVLGRGPWRALIVRLCASALVQRPRRP